MIDEIDKYSHHHAIIEVVFTNAAFTCKQFWKDAFSKENNQGNAKIKAFICYCLSDVMDTNEIRDLLGVHWYRDIQYKHNTRAKRLMKETEVFRHAIHETIKEIRLIKQLHSQSETITEVA